MLTSETIERLRDPGNRRLIVALSGGVDSVVLLDLVASLDTDRLRAVHVNHHLHAGADDMAAFCAVHAAHHGIEIDILDVDVDPCGSVETNARAARYAAIESILMPGDLLLLAHHADDQVETILFRLLRGGGGLGVEGMPQERAIGPARLYRPLLERSREDILSHARHRQLDWRDDPTNADIAMDRNYIRHELLPRVLQRFPGARRAILQAADNDVLARQRLHAALLDDLEPVRAAPDALVLEGLRRVETRLLPGLIQAWLADLGAPMPSTAMIGELVQQITAGHAVKVQSSGLLLAEHAGTLVACRPLPDIDPGPFMLGDEQRGAAAGITNKKVKGRGLKQGSYQVRFRAGGEKLRMSRNRTLRNLFQEKNVPVWLRNRVPLLYHHDELVAVAGLPGWQVDMLIARDWQAGPGESGLLVEYDPGDRIRGLAAPA